MGAALVLKQGFQIEFLDGRAKDLPCGDLLSRRGLPLDHDLGVTCGWKQYPKFVRPGADVRVHG